MSNLAETDRVYLFQAITQEMLAAISQFMPQEAVNCVWEIVSESGEPCLHAFVFSDMGVFYNFKDSGAGRFGYDEVVGGLLPIQVSNSCYAAEHTDVDCNSPNQTF